MLEQEVISQKREQIRQYVTFSNFIVHKKQFNLYINHSASCPKFSNIDSRFGV